MKVSEIRVLKEEIGSKFFVSPDGDIITTDGLHEGLARKICIDNNWKWPGVSAEDFIITEHKYIKYSNYSESCFRYVAVSEKASKEIIENACFLADYFNLRIEWYD